jgi:hypothetical protein
MNSSYKNQNRLHLGFHYPRCKITRNKCKKYFGIFKNKYLKITDTIYNNIYAIANKSNINYNDFIELFDKEDYIICKNDILINVNENIIKTNEKYINYKKAKEYFKNKFNNRITFQCNYNVKKIENINNIVKINDEYEYDKVFNCTYNQINDGINSDIYYEKCLTLLYKKINKTNFDCITIMDGDYFSIYKYNNNDIYTLTHVSLTPLIKDKNYENVEKCNDFDIHKKIELFENEVLKYYPLFKESFIYYDYYISFKCKNISNDDSRNINIYINDNLFNTWCGKISFIFELDTYINKFIYS